MEAQGSPGAGKPKTKITIVDSGALETLIVTYTQEKTNKKYISSTNTVYYFDTTGFDKIDKYDICCNHKYCRIILVFFNAFSYTVVD